MTFIIFEENKKSDKKVFFRSNKQQNQITLF